MRRGFALVLAGMLVLAVAGTALADGIETSETCVKFENEAIGVDGISATLDGVTVTLSGWIAKDGEPDEFIGFSYAFSGGEFTDAVKVKSGRGVAYVTDGSFMNGAEDAKAISHAEFCTPQTGGGDDPGGDVPGGDDPTGVIDDGDTSWLDG